MVAFLTNDAGSTGGLHAECKLNHSYHLVLSLSQVNQESPHKTRQTETNRKETGKSLEHMGTGENFLNRSLIAYSVR